MFGHGHEGHSSGSEYRADQAWSIACDEFGVLEVDDTRQVEAHASHAVHGAVGVVLHHDCSLRGRFDGSRGVTVVQDKEAANRAQGHRSFESEIAEHLLGFFAVDGLGPGIRRAHMLCPKKAGETLCSREIELGIDAIWSEAD